MLYLSLGEKEVRVGWGSSGVEGRGRYGLATRGSGPSGSEPLGEPQGTREEQLHCLPGAPTAPSWLTLSAPEGWACLFSGGAGGGTSWGLICTKTGGGEEP